MCSSSGSNAHRRTAAARDLQAISRMRPGRGHPSATVGTQVEFLATNAEQRRSARDRPDGARALPRCRPRRRRRARTRPVQLHRRRRRRRPHCRGAAGPGLQRTWSWRQVSAGRVDGGLAVLVPLGCSRCALRRWPGEQWSGGHQPRPTARAGRDRDAQRLEELGIVVPTLSNPAWPGDVPCGTGRRRRGLGLAAVDADQRGTVVHRCGGSPLYDARRAARTSALMRRSSCAQHERRRGRPARWRTRSDLVLPAAQAVGRSLGCATADCVGRCRLGTRRPPWRRWPVGVDHGRRRGSPSRARWARGTRVSSGRRSWTWSAITICSFMVGSVARVVCAGA